MALKGTLGLIYIRTEADTLNPNLPIQDFRGTRGRRTAVHTFCDCDFRLDEGAWNACSYGYTVTVNLS